MAYRQLRSLIREDEASWIEANQERCDKCTHLEIFHYEDDEFNRTYCLVHNCNCSSKTIDGV